MSREKINIRRLTGVGLLTALVIVLQFLALMIRPAGFFNITLCLVPIVVGAALYGVWAGGFLGFVFGAVVTLTDSAAFMVINAPATIAVCLFKGLLAGLAAGGVYKLIEKRNVYAAAIAAAAICPIVNTGVFAIGCFLFFMPVISEWAQGTDAVLFLFAGVITANFFIELLANLALSSVIVSVIKLAKRKNC